MTGLPGYDAWKTRAPEDDGRVCSDCGEWMHTIVGGWHCERCDERDADRLREDRDERSRMEREP